MTLVPDNETITAREAVKRAREEYSKAPFCTTDRERAFKKLQSAWDVFSEVRTRKIRELGLEIF